MSDTFSDFMINQQEKSNQEAQKLKDENQQLRQRVDELEKQLKNAREAEVGWQRVWEEANDRTIDQYKRIAELEVRINALEQVLSFYGDPSQSYDGGERAHAALEGKDDG